LPTLGQIFRPRVAKIFSPLKNIRAFCRFFFF
jgi:hypothetical protein